MSIVGQESSAMGDAQTGRDMGMDAGLEAEDFDATIGGIYKSFRRQDLVDTILLEKLDEKDGHLMEGTL
jgi:hypothetical protein